MGELAEYLAQHEPNFRKARLPALYSDFRPQRTLNPDGYRANISAWRQALSRLASDGQLPRHSSDSSAFVLNIDQALLRSLESRQYGQPLALGTVIREAAADKDLVPLQAFLKASQGIYQRNWSDIPWNVMGWTLRQMGVVDPARGEDKLPEGRYVMLANLEAAGRQLSGNIASKASRFDRIFTKAQFQKTFGADLVTGHGLSDTDLDVLLTFLSRDKALIAYDGQTIRVKGSGESGNDITEEDTAIASIKELSMSLSHQINLLETRLHELDLVAKDAVAHKNRVSALAALKSKKITESSLAKRHASMNQLEEVAAKIEQAADNAQLVRVMASSTDALKGLNAQVGDADRVDGVMERLREQMGETDEVAAILAESGGAAAVDEGEIDEELEAMERAEKAKEEESQRRAEEARNRDKESKDAAAAQKHLDEMPTVPSGELPAREKAQTPTSETGIGNLSLGGEEETRRQAERAMHD